MRRVANAPKTACFSVHAAAEPSVMPRVMEQFAKRGLVPCQWHSSLAPHEVPDRTMALVIDIQIDGLEPALLAPIAEALRRIVYVDAVLTAEKDAA
jgi:acetolactate synthase small subunit